MKTLLILLLINNTPQGFVSVEEFDCLGEQWWDSTENVMVYDHDVHKYLTSKIN